MSAPGSPLHVLVVDDDPSLAGAARALLSRKGCRLESVFSGFDAVARVRAGGIDEVLMDVRMPHVDGLSALEQIASLPNPPRVVLMSGNIDAKVEEAVASGRALACLEKPVDFELALTLLSGTLPDHPLELRPKLDRAALVSFAAQALSRGVSFVEGAPQLPPGTPLSVQLIGASGTPFSLLAVADLTARPPGQRGLGLKLVDLTEAQREALRALVAPAPVEQGVLREGQKSKAQELYHRGLERLEAGKYDKALLDLKRALDEAPGDALIRAATLRAEQLAGVEKARSLFREAVEVAEKEPAEALRLVEDALRLDPSRASYHQEAARLYLLAGDGLQKAEQCLSAAVHLAPSDPDPRLHLSQLLDRAGRQQEALWCCEAALGLFPGDKELLKLEARLKRKLEG